ncbi:hypothetical protein [Staphylococcus lutrae]|nr:hypothetical protein [Staphylococcus lutrae]
MCVQQKWLIDIKNERSRLNLGKDIRQVKTTNISRGKDVSLDFIALCIMKYSEKATVEKLVQSIPTSAETLLEHNDFHFYERYYPGVLYYMAKRMRQAFYQKLKSYGLSLYGEQDWQSFIAVRDWIRQTYIRMD